MGWIGSSSPQLPPGTICLGAVAYWWVYTGPASFYARGINGVDALGFFRDWQRSVLHRRVR